MQLYKILKWCCLSSSSIFRPMNFSNGYAKKQVGKKKKKNITKKKKEYSIDSKKSRNPRTNKQIGMTQAYILN